MQICDNAPASTATYCEVGVGEWRRGATHEINAVRLAQREMTADYSAMPLSTSVFTLYHPWLPKKKEEEEKKYLSIQTKKKPEIHLNSISKTATVHNVH